MGALEGSTLDGSVAEAAELLVMVAGQDTEGGDDGSFRIMAKVPRDRMISTVDPEARHGHKSRHRHFDGYKAHLSVNPDSELIDEAGATPASSPDRQALDELLADHAHAESKPQVVDDSA